jgi:hypothetical protein
LSKRNGTKEKDTRISLNSYKVSWRVAQAKTRYAQTLAYLIHKPTHFVGATRRDPTPSVNAFFFFGVRSLSLRGNDGFFIGNDGLFVGNNILFKGRCPLFVLRLICL